MKYLLISWLGCFAASALAADCSRSAPSIPSELLHVYWDARNQMCSNAKCALGKDCSVQTAASVNNKLLSVILTRRKNGVNGFKDCYAATDNIINQCVYGEHKLNGRWEFAGQTFTMTSDLVDTTPPPQGCNVAKYCNYTFKNDNCRITTWKGDGNVPVFFECVNSKGCTGGAQCINGLCCDADKLVLGASLCPTVNDLQKCGGYQRSTGGAGRAAWVPPHTDIPAGLKCGC